MKEGLSKYDILEYLKTLLGSDNAWRTSAELGKHFNTDSNQVAQLLFPLRSDGLVITRNRAGTNGVREVMVSETGQAAQRGRKAPRTEIRRAKEIKVPVVEVVTPADTGKTECLGTEGHAGATVESGPLEDSTGTITRCGEMPDRPPQPAGDLAAAALIATCFSAGFPRAAPDPPAAAGVAGVPFEPADNAGGIVLIGSEVAAHAQRSEMDALAGELDALENTLTRGKRAPVVVDRKSDKQRMLLELARRIDPDAPLTAFLLREVVHDLERAA